MTSWLVHLLDLWRVKLWRVRGREELICQLNRDRGYAGTWRDLHDYPDWVIPEPAHFVELPCRRCGQRFGI